MLEERPDAEIFSPKTPDTLSKCIFQLGEESLEAIAEVREGVGVAEEAAGGGGLIVKTVTNVTCYRLYISITGTFGWLSCVVMFRTFLQPSRLLKYGKK